MEGIAPDVPAVGADGLRRDSPSPAAANDPAGGPHDLRPLKPGISPCRANTKRDSESQSGGQTRSGALCLNAADEHESRLTISIRYANTNRDTESQCGRRRSSREDTPPTHT